MVSSEELIEELGFSSSVKHNEQRYKNLLKVSYFMVNRILKDSYEVYGQENLEEDYYQMFLCDHKYYTDPVFIQIAIALASGNEKPIPAPAHKSYVKHKVLGRIMIPLFSYPIYGKEDGYTKKEQSMQYSVECFLKQDRILVFPEGRISQDGKLATGKIGSAEIAFRAYHLIEADKKLRKKKKGLKIIPMEISYAPMAGIPWKNIDKTTIRFGESLDFEDEFIDKFYAVRNKLRDKEKLKKNLQIKLMKKVMDRIGSMTTVNMDNVASKTVYGFARKGKSFVEQEQLEKKLWESVEALNKSKLYLLDHLKDEELAKKAYNDFLKRCKKKKIISKYKSKFRLDLEYILAEPEFKYFRGENIILYNCNILEHSKEFKECTEH